MTKDQQWTLALNIAETEALLHAECQNLEPVDQEKQLSIEHKQCLLVDYRAQAESIKNFSHLLKKARRYQEYLNLIEYKCDQTHLHTMDQLLAYLAHDEMEAFENLTNHVKWKTKVERQQWQEFLTQVDEFIDNGLWHAFYEMFNYCISELYNYMMHIRHPEFFDKKLEVNQESFLEKTTLEKFLTYFNKLVKRGGSFAKNGSPTEFYEPEGEQEFIEFLNKIKDLYRHPICKALNNVLQNMYFHLEQTLLEE